MPILKPNDCLAAHRNLELITLQFDEDRERTVALVPYGYAHVAISPGKRKIAMSANEVVAERPLRKSAT